MVVMMQILRTLLLLAVMISIIAMPIHAESEPEPTEESDSTEASSAPASAPEEASSVNSAETSSAESEDSPKEPILYQLGAAVFQSVHDKDCWLTQAPLLCKLVCGPYAGEDEGAYSQPNSKQPGVFLREGQDSRKSYYTGVGFSLTGQCPGE